jgi:hypothetical protein
MKGQRTGLIRGTLALLLCAILLSTFFTTTVFGGRSDPPRNADPVVARTASQGDGPLSDDGGTGDAPTDGDPDDYDKIVVDVWVLLVEFPLVPIF